MKYILFLFFLILFQYSSVAQTEVEQRIKFRHMPWGAKVDSMYVMHGNEKKKIEFQEHERNTMTRSFEYDFKDNVYTIKDDDLHIGAAELLRIYYVFDDNDRFNKVVVYGNGFDYRDLNFILKNKFGSADEIQYLDGRKVKIWNVDEVDFILTTLYLDGYFQLEILSNWRFDKDFQKNLEVDDF